MLPGSGGSSRARPAACARERDERTAVPTPRWFESARSCPAAAALPTCPGPALHRTVPQSVHGRTRQERVSFMHALPRGTTHPEPSSTHLKGRVRERLLHGLEVIAVCRETRETQSQRQHAWRHLTYVRCRIRTVNGAQRSVDEQPDRCKDGQIADARVAFAARHLQGKKRRHVVRNSSQVKSSKARQVKSGSSRSPRANHTTVPQRTAPHLWSMGSIKVVVEQQLNRKSPSPWRSLSLPRSGRRYCDSLAKSIAKSFPSLCTYIQDMHVQSTFTSTSAAALSREQNRPPLQTRAHDIHHTPPASPSSRSNLCKHVIAVCSALESSGCQKSMKRISAGTSPSLYAECMNVVSKTTPVPPGAAS